VGLRPIAGLSSPQSVKMRTPRPVATIYDNSVMLLRAHIRAVADQAIK
jgi:hypothetical protein